MTLFILKQIILYLSIGVLLCFISILFQRRNPYSIFNSTNKSMIKFVKFTIFVWPYMMFPIFYRIFYYLITKKQNRFKK